MPNPSPIECDSSSKDKDVSSAGSKSSQRNPTNSQSKVGGVDSVELLITQIQDFNFDPSVTKALISPLQELIKIFINKSREIRAGIRGELIDRMVAPYVKIFQDRHTTYLENIMITLVMSTSIRDNIRLKFMKAN
ncbi:hypothetical protein AVEN_187345-1 [Araneus ventricosus]|uniref:Uncharacterized protein n=1 Tax=Araneus ventricosus TaxID=182803 RepID=A0A4Y2Q794_ARAVE|nr:hypothetical protein AVEN_187345-1 [Araneus ventricosus]